MGAERYDQRQVEEILRRAIDRDQREAAKLERADIVAAAEELGIEPHSVQQAMVEIDLDAELADEVELIRLRRKSKWLSHVSSWVVVNAFLFAIDLLTGGGWWFYWPLLSWGLFVVLDTLRVLRADEQQDRERARKRLAKRHARRDKLARKEQKKRTERELEEAIERGVHALLGAAARRLAAAAEAVGSANDDQARPRIDPAAAAPSPATDEEASAREQTAVEEQLAAEQHDEVAGRRT